MKDVNNYCEKIDAYVTQNEDCDSIDRIMPKSVKESHTERRSRQKRERDERHRKKLESVHEATRNRLFSPVTIWQKNDKTYLKRWYIGKANKYAKKAASKKLRQHKGEVQNGSNYKKFFDILWHIW